MAQLTPDTRINPSRVVDLLVELTRYFDTQPPAKLSRESDLFILLQECLPEWHPRTFKRIEPFELCTVECKLYAQGICMCARFRQQQAGDQR